MTDNPNDFVESVLKEVIAAEQITGYTLNFKPGCEDGVGKSSELLCVTVAGSSTSAEPRQLHLVCKRERANIDRLRDFMTMICFAREINFYNNIGPLFMDFQSEKCLDEADHFRAIVKCHVAVKDELTDRYAIILDDLRTEKFTMWNSTKPLPVDHLRQALCELGRFHGISMAMKHQKPLVFERFTQNDNIPKEFIESGQLQALLNPAYDYAIQVLRNEEHQQIMSQAKTKMIELFEWCLGKKASSRFGVVSHGDFWNNNILYRYNENGNVGDVRFLDWQINGYTSPVIDIMYLVFSASDRQLRAAYYDSVLRSYYDSLERMITALGSDPKELFTFADLQDELKRYGAFAFLVTPMLLQVSLLTTDDGDQELANAMFAERYNDVVTDLIKLGYHSDIL